jgi:hypothetical protein
MIGAAALFVCAGSGVALGQDETTTLLMRLAEKSLAPSVLFGLEKQPTDPRIVPALQSAFDSRSAKEERQEIAVTILRLGERGDKYFNYLAGFVREAIEDSTPYFQTTRGQFTAEFENWCAQHRKDPRSVAAIQLGYFEDVRFLAKAQDGRATELFRHGLGSPNPLVVVASVEGLGRLQDTGALPLIETAAERVPGAKGAISMQLPWFRAVEAYRLMERLEPNPKAREMYVIWVRQQQRTQIENALDRSGRTPAK